MQFSYTISHIPGKNLIIADTLSRSPITETDDTLEKEVQTYLECIHQSLPATDNFLHKSADSIQRDPVCAKLIQYCQQGWPDRFHMKGPVKSYYPVANELSYHNKLLYRGNRLIIPPELQSEVLSRLHSVHQGVTKCLARAKQSVWWPGLHKQLSSLVSNCRECCKQRKQHAEPLLPTPLPEYPWHTVGSDLFVWNGVNYILVVDCYSCYIEIAKLTSTTTSKDVITRVGKIWATFSFRILHSIDAFGAIVTELLMSSYAFKIDK